MAALKALFYMGLGFIGVVVVFFTAVFIIATIRVLMGRDHATLAAASQLGIHDTVAPRDETVAVLHRPRHGWFSRAKTIIKEGARR